MRRKDILDAVAACVLSDREQQYGAPEDVFSVIAGLWSVYLDRTVKSHDVAAMMVLLKVARLTGNPAHGDSWTDIAGYAACGGELATPLPKETQEWQNGDLKVTYTSMREKPQAPEMGLGPK
jgi:hypothetical protein